MQGCCQAGINSFKLKLETLNVDISDYCLVHCAGIEGPTFRRLPSHHSATRMVTSALAKAGTMGSIHSSAVVMGLTMAAMSTRHGRISMRISRLR